MKKTLIFSVLMLFLIGFISAPNTDEIIGCTDSDGGKNYFVKGDVITLPSTGDDFCVFAEEGLNSGMSECAGPEGPCTYDCEVDDCNFIREYYCSDDDSIESIVYECPNGCDEGACVREDDAENEDETNDEKEKSGKVCCKKSWANAKSEREMRYIFIEKDSCVPPEDSTDNIQHTREIVDGDLCEQERERIKEAIQEKNRIRMEGECPEECTCAGSTIKCTLSSGREMTVMAGNSGNTIVQIKGTEVSTEVELYKDGEKIFGKFKNDESKEIITPDQVKEKIQERIKQKDCDCEEMELTEDAKYEVQTKKKARLFWIFPVREKSNVEVDAENGEVIKFRNPWWGFLAKDNVEEETTE